MQKTRDPLPQELKLVVLVDDIQYHAFLPRERIESIMDSLEDRLKGPGIRPADRISQMSLRQTVSRRLRDRTLGKPFFDDLGGAACLWLGLRHYDSGEHLMRGLDEMIERGVVLTVSIGDSPAAAEGTAWSFMIGGDIHDGRQALSAYAPDQVMTFRNGQD